MIKALGLVFMLGCVGLPFATAAHIRLAAFNVGLGRDGPGLLLKDILAQKPDILALVKIIHTVNPDIILLTGFDNDAQNIALGRFNAIAGLQYPFLFAPLGNEGTDSGLDINGDGRLHEGADDWGYGKFEGGKGMALLSRYPIGKTRKFNTLLWRDLGPNPQTPDGRAFYPPPLWAQLRLASHSLWDIEILAPTFPLHIIAAHPTPPVFDGAENANGLRNAAEITFLARYLSGEAFRDDAGKTAPVATGPVALLADLNADPEKGDGLKPALRRLLAHPRLQDAAPYDTADWASTGRLRADYVLPDARLDVGQSGVFWPENAAILTKAHTRHRLIWADISAPKAPLE